MSVPASTSAIAISDVEVLRQFALNRVLNEDPVTHSLTLLGTLPSIANEAELAILRLERVALSTDAAQSFRKILHSTKLIEQTDIYSWLFAWFENNEQFPDVKISIICPATDVHIRKHSKQSILMVHETPELYEHIIKPYIAAFPPSRTQWVKDISSGRSEADKVLHRDETPENGYVILPDMKWDLTSISTLYLVAIATRPDIRSLRDLRKIHLPLLRSIRTEARRIVQDKWGLAEGNLRFYVHYQPSYYHFHVHIVNVNYVGLTSSMAVGSAHLLEDLISLIELSPGDEDTLLQKMTFTYALGEQHGLFEQMKDAQQ